MKTSAHYTNLVKNFISTAKVGQYITAKTVINESVFESEMARALTKESLVEKVLESFVTSGNLKKTASGNFYEVISTEVK